MTFPHVDFFFPVRIQMTWNHGPQWRAPHKQHCLEFCCFEEKADLCGVIAMSNNISSVTLFLYLYHRLFPVVENHCKTLWICTQLIWIVFYFRRMRPFFFFFFSSSLFFFLFFFIFWGNICLNVCSRSCLLSKEPCPISWVFLSLFQ